MAFLLIGKLRHNDIYNIPKVRKPVNKEPHFGLRWGVQLEFLLCHQKINPLSHFNNVLGKYHTHKKK